MTAGMTTVSSAVPSPFAGSSVIAIPAAVSRTASSGSGHRRGSDPIVREPRFYGFDVGPPISVLIADDQTLVRAGFRAILESYPDIAVVGEAADGRDAVELARTRHPDVVLMDVQMPGTDGIEATRLLVGSDVSIIILTTFDVDEYVYEALRAGASGFLLKDVPPEDLVTAIRVVAGGDALIAPAITKRLIERFARSAPPGTPPPGLELLTPREREVLTLVARGRSNGEIAGDLVLSHETVKTHVKRTFAKLGVRDRAQAVVAAYEAGLVAPGDSARER